MADLRYGGPEHARNSHKTTSGVKFDLKFDFPVPDFLWQEILEIRQRFHVF